MLYLLSELSEYWGPLRLFEYVTFRAVGATAMSFLIVVLFGGAFARYLKKLNTQAASRYAGLFDEQWVDKEKEKTPCMGGILLIGAVVICSLFWMKLTSPISLILIFSTVGFSLIGFWDDYQKVFKKNREGISERAKLISQFTVAILALVTLFYLPGVGDYMSDFMVPFFKEPASEWSIFAGVPHWIWVGLCSIMALGAIVGATNAVNITDGKDGLAAGCTIFCALTYAAIAYLMGHRVFADYLSIPHIVGISEAVVFSAAIVGACIGFLWHNCYPAAMFMGDTGSLALGGAIGLLSVLTRQELLLIVVGGVFVIEIGSTIIQRLWFKYSGGKRVFLCTPIHHHFERKNWGETQIVVRFWIMSGLFALLALSSLKLR